MGRSVAEIRRDVWYCARMGVAFGAVLSVWATVLYVLGAREAFEERHASLVGFIAWYLGSSAAAGVLVGLVRPLTRTLLGTIATALLVMIPVALAFHLLASGLTPLTRLDLELLGMMVLIGGTVGGTAAWRGRQ